MVKSYHYFLLFFFAFILNVVGVTFGMKISTKDRPVEPKPTTKKEPPPHKKNKPKEKQVNKYLINKTLLAKSIVYHAIFIALKVRMDDLDNLDSRYIDVSQVNLQWQEVPYFFLATALNHIEQALLSPNINKIAYNLLISMYITLSVIANISMHPKLGKAQKVIITLLSAGDDNTYFTPEVAQGKSSSKELLFMFIELINLNEKILKPLLPIFSGCGHNAKNKEDLLVHYKGNFPNINFLELSTHNQYFTETTLTKEKRMKCIDTLHEEFKKKYWGK